MTAEERVKLMKHNLRLYGVRGRSISVEDANWLIHKLEITKASKDTYYEMFIEERNRRKSYQEVLELVEVMGTRVEMSDEAQMAKDVLEGDPK